MKEISIYTDGACSGNPGPGGWGAILMYQAHKKEISGAESMTTNNRMEITAAIEAFRLLREPCRVKIYTDSAYLCNAFQQGWLAKWQKNNWINSKKQPVENRDLWEQILSLLKMHQVTWIKVRGHSDNVYNNRCDMLARNAIKTLGKS